MTTPLDKKQSPPTAHQPLSEIAYACGFRANTHFARKFFRRFGHTPRAHSAELDGAGDRVVRANTGESAPSAHDVNLQRSNFLCSICSPTSTALSVRRSGKEARHITGE